MAPLKNLARFLFSRATKQMPGKSESTHQSYLIGQRKQSALTNATKSSGSLKFVALNQPARENPPLSSGIETMSVLATLSSVASVLQTVSGAVKNTETVFNTAKTLMEAVESAYKSGEGASKKTAVLSALDALYSGVMDGWDLIRSQISAWIDATISAWNSLKSLASSDDSSDSEEETATDADEADSSEDD